MEVLLKQVVSSRPTSIGLFDDVVQGHKNTVEDLGPFWVT